MTTEHTKGKLHVAGQEQVQIRSDKHQVAKAWCFAGKTGQANARRLVAAWNCCDGLPTPDLENSALPEILKNLLEAKAQRDELLEALKLASGALCRAATDIAEWGAYAPAHFQSKHKLADDVQAYVNAADHAHAAIAKVAQKN